MYGTTMIAKTSASREAVQAAFDAWLRERAPQVVGFVDAGVMFGDDGVTLINWARFTDKATYQTLADDPDQDAFWQSHMAPLIDGDPQWVDGEWLSLS